jgi:hypothetical protein
VVDRSHSAAKMPTKLQNINELQVVYVIIVKPNSDVFLSDFAIVLHTYTIV